MVTNATVLMAKYSTKTESATLAMLSVARLVHLPQPTCVLTALTATGQILWMENVTAGGHRRKSQIQKVSALTAM